MINESSRALYRSAQIVWYLLFVLESLLALRFVLQLLQANVSAPFTNFIYTVSNPFVWPFAAVFQNEQVAQSVFEWTTLLAMLIYWLLVVAIIKLFVVGKPVTAVEADQNLVD